MKNLFQQIKLRKPRSNKFDLSHERKMSFNMGELIPTLVQEVVPGDKFRVNAEVLMRLAPMLAPVMHRVNVYTHYFFVPNRLVWNEWEDFITGGEDGLAAPVFPTINAAEARKWAFDKGLLADYLGIPVMDQIAVATNPLTVSTLPFRAYQTIYNEYYRDQNLTDPVPFTIGSTTSGAEFTEIVTLRKRAWEKDYFTSALPWAQRGGEVSVPGSPNYKSVGEIVDSTGTPVSVAADLGQSSAGLMTVNKGVSEETGNVRNLEDIGVNINELRKAVRLQEWLEKNARAGSRYIEQILSHFGVKSSDARLQRPEYLGGGKNPVVISEVLNTTGNTGELPQGNMAGHGLSVGQHNSFSKSFEEHGYIIGIMSVLPRTTYQQGVDKTFQKFDKFDYFWPEFAQLGEQEVKKSEIYHDYVGAVGQGDVTFGYQSRYAEYKFKASSVHGDFRDELAYWHMGRIFASDVSLNTSFIEADPTHRIFAVTDPTEAKLYCQLYNKIDALRPMPYFGEPTL